MKGLGRGTAAITVVNALLCGKGCAAAITLGCEVSIELRRVGPGELARSRIPEESATPLVRGSLAAALRAFAPGEFMEATLSIASAIPIAKGLKSSSAVGVAIFDAVARAVGRREEPEDIALRAANVAQQIGLSATGAYDDALAASLGGVVVTENSDRQSLATGDAPSELPVLLWVPTLRHPPSANLVSRFAGLGAEGEAAIANALEGRYFEAMTRNTAAVERVMAYPYGPLRQKLVRMGVEAAGVSGMGPALALVTPAESLTAVEGLLRPSGGELIVTRFREPGEVGEPVSRAGARS
jgi:shikimate kinase